MYCPIERSESNNRCQSRCCRLYDLALAFLAGIILFTLGLIFGSQFAPVFAAALAVLVTAVVILFIVFIVTLITRGCCNRSSGFGDDE